jgi:hypothetical protein
LSREQREDLIGLKEIEFEDDDLGTIVAGERAQPGPMALRLQSSIVLELVLVLDQVLLNS